MKIITENSAYLQKYYFNILVKSTLVTDTGIPMSLWDITYTRKFKNSDSNDFLKFTRKNEIEFLKNADWIPDFNDYINKTIEEIKQEIESIDNEGKEINDWFLTASEESKQFEGERANVKAKMLMFKKNSLINIISYKKSNAIPEYNIGFVKRIGKLIQRNTK